MLWHQVELVDRSAFKRVKPEIIHEGLPRYISSNVIGKTVVTGMQDEV